MVGRLADIKKDGVGEVWQMILIWGFGAIHRVRQLKESLPRGN